MALFPRRQNNLEAERQRLAQINPQTWRDSDGNLIAPMADEPNQWVTDEELK